MRLMCRKKKARGTGAQVEVGSEKTKEGRCIEKK
jgi:hypothetical protein